LEFSKGSRLDAVTLTMHSRRHVDCVQLGFHVPTLPPPFLPASPPAPFDFVVWHLALYLVFLPQSFVFFLFPFYFPTAADARGAADQHRGGRGRAGRLEDGKGANARFNCPVGITEGFADGQGEAARFNWPTGVALAANDEIVVTDTENHAIWVVTPGCKKGGAVTSDSPCSCTAESRDCRARSSLLFLSCRKWLYALPIIVQLLSSSVHVVLGE
jgi:hypothetical protein